MQTPVVIFLIVVISKASLCLPKPKDGAGFAAVTFFNSSKATIEKRTLRTSDGCPTTLDSHTKAKFIDVFEKAEPMLGQAISDGKGYWRATLKMCQELVKSLKDSIKPYECSGKILRWTAGFSTLSKDFKDTARYWGAVNTFYELALDEGFTTLYSEKLSTLSAACRRDAQSAYEHLSRTIRSKSYEANANLISIAQKIDKRLAQEIDEANAMRLTDRPIFLSVYDNCVEALDYSEFNTYFLKAIKDKVDSCK